MDNINLSGFMTLLREDVARFEVYYKAHHQEDPESWPMDLGADEWYSCFTEFVKG